MNVYEAALKKWGKSLQVMMMIEEMSELTKELIKDFRKQGDIHKILEEMADVEIMLTQMKMIYGDCKLEKDKKLFRLANMLREGE